MCNRTFFFEQILYFFVRKMYIRCTDYIGGYLIFVKCIGNAIVVNQEIAVRENLVDTEEPYILQFFRIFHGILFGNPVYKDLCQVLLKTFYKDVVFLDQVTCFHIYDMIRKRMGAMSTTCVIFKVDSVT